MRLFERVMGKAYSRILPESKLGGFYRAREAIAANRSLGQTERIDAVDLLGEERSFEVLREVALDKTDDDYVRLSAMSALSRMKKREDLDMAEIVHEVIESVARDENEYDGLRERIINWVMDKKDRMNIDTLLAISTNRNDNNRVRCTALDKLCPSDAGYESRRVVVTLISIAEDTKEEAISAETQLKLGFVTPVG